MTTAALVRANLAEQSDIFNARAVMSSTTIFSSIFQVTYVW